MMPHFILCFVLVPFVGMFSEKREVDLNSFVLLFDNVTADSLETEISLHKNGDKNPDLIVKWNIINGDITAKWRMTKCNKIFMDGNKRIYIANIDKDYEGKYHIQYSQERDVEIVISGISYDTTPTRSPKNGTEGISPDTNPTRSPNNETEGGSVTIGVLVMIIVVFVFMVLMTVVYICFKRGRWHCKKENENEEQEMPLMKTSWLSTKKFGKLKWENIMQLLNGDQQQGLRKHCEVLNGEYPQLWQCHLGNMKLENIIQLLKSDQQQDLRKHCEMLIEEYPQLWQTYFGKLKWKNIMQLLNDDQQQGLRKHCDAEAEKIIDIERSKKKQNPKVMKRTGELPKDVYRFLCDNKLFDPNVLE